VVGRPRTRCAHLLLLLLLLRLTESITARTTQLRDSCLRRHDEKRILISLLCLTECSSSCTATPLYESDSCIAVSWSVPQPILAPAIRQSTMARPGSHPFARAFVRRVRDEAAADDGPRLPGIEWVFCEKLIPPKRRKHRHCCTVDDIELSFEFIRTLPAK
jgi:hypothetical protein